MRVNVSGHDGGYAQAPCELLELSVASPVPPRVCSLQLDPQCVRAEGIEQSSGSWLLGDPVLGAAREADQPVGVLEHPLQRDARLACVPVGTVACMSVREREQATEISPAMPVADEQRQMPQRTTTI